MGWHSYKLGDILKRRKSVEKILPDKEYKLVTIKLYHKGVILRHIAMGSEIKSSMSSVRAGDFILSGIDARNGAFGIVPEELDGAIITNDFWCLEPDTSKINADFFLYLTSTSFFDAICKESSDGTTQRIRLQKERFFNYRVELPSIEEQKNILSKLRRSGTIGEALSTELSHQTELILKLRQNILQEAMQGRLVKQNSKDEPASILLEKIRKQKRETEDLKKEKEITQIKINEIPFELPKGWIWCRLENISKNIHYGFTASANHNDKSVRLLRITDIQDNKVMWETVPGCNITSKEYDNYALQENDILIARTGGTIGKSYIVKNLSVKAVFASYLIRVIPHSLINADFLKLFIESPLYWKQLVEMSSGTGQPNVNGTSLKTLITPLPPMDEQQRIVYKVEELMKICNGLEKEASTSNHQKEKLLQTILREAFSKD